jgi:hypothetical protein
MRRDGEGKPWQVRAFLDHLCEDDRLFAEGLRVAAPSGRRKRLARRRPGQAAASFIIEIVHAARRPARPAVPGDDAKPPPGGIRMNHDPEIKSTVFTCRADNLEQARRRESAGSKGGRG